MVARRFAPFEDRFCRENPVWVQTDGTVTVNSPSFGVPIAELAEILAVSNVTVYAPMQGSFGFLPEPLWDRFAVSRTISGGIVARPLNGRTRHPHTPFTFSIPREAAWTMLPVPVTLQFHNQGDNHEQDIPSLHRGTVLLSVGRHGG